jgi:hypothetical protein
LGLKDAGQPVFTTDISGGRQTKAGFVRIELAPILDSTLASLVLVDQNFLFALILVPEFFFKTGVTVIAEVTICMRIPRHILLPLFVVSCFALRTPREGNQYKSKKDTFHHKHPRSCRTQRYHISVCRSERWKGKG